MLLARQWLISVEVLATMTVLGGLIAVGHVLLCPPLRRATIGLAGWALLTAVLLTPVTAVVVVEMLRHAPPRALNPRDSYSLDLLKASTDATSPPAPTQR